MKFTEVIRHLLLKKNNEQSVYLGSSDSVKEYMSVYYKALAYYIGVSYIAETVARCPLKITCFGKNVKFDADFKTDRISIVDYKSLLYHYGVAPNKNQSAYDFWRDIVFGLYYSNENTVIVFNEDNQFFYSTNFTVVEDAINGNRYENIAIDYTTKTFSRNCDDVIVIRLDDKGINRFVNGMLNDFQRLYNVAAGHYNNNNGSKYKISTSNVLPTDTNNTKETKKSFLQETKSQFDDFAKKPNATVMLTAGMRLEEIAKSSKDASDLKDIQKNMFESAASALKMPVSMLYGNVNNYKDVISGWASFTIETLVDNISKAVSVKSLPVNDIKAGSWIKHDTSQLFHMEWWDMCEKSQWAIGLGTHNINDVRERMGEDAIKLPFASIYWLSKNYDRVENMLSDIERNGEGGEKE